MANEVGREYRLEVQSTIDSVKTITGITKANPAVVSVTAHGYANGDIVILTDVEGMVEVNNLVARVANQASGTFELAGVNSTNFGTFVSGEVAEITAFTTVTQATGVDFGAGSAEEIDMTTLIDSTRRVEDGILSLPQITVNLLADPPAAAQAAIETAAYAKTVLAFRATTKGGRIRLWAGTPSTIGESVSVNSPITGSFTINVKSPRYINYAS
jgi:hypothetical protein